MIEKNMIHSKYNDSKNNNDSLSDIMNCNDIIIKYDLQGGLAEWLALLRLSEYNSMLERQGFASPRHMMSVVWEDLEQMGITRLGHQKKVGVNLFEQFI